MSTAASRTTWTRRFVGTGIAFFVLWQVVYLLGYHRAGTVYLGLYGFVFCVVFGKAYTLVPSYFDRPFERTWAPIVHFPLAVAGVIGLFVGSIDQGYREVGSVGALLWVAGVIVFVGALGLTIRDNLTGKETGTGPINEHREGIDRLANAFVPIVLLYLLIGGFLTVTHWIDGIQILDLDHPAMGIHALAVGTATLLVFAIGFRLLPRFLVTTPRPAFVLVALVSGAIAPLLLVYDFLGGTTFTAGAVLQTVAIVTFAIAFFDMSVRSDRRRVGFIGVGLGAIAGVLAVVIGAHFAVVSIEPGLIDAHRRLAIGGFLGLTIIGVTYQFYPPAVASRRWVSDRSALASIALLFVGLLIESLGFVTGYQWPVTVGSLTTLAGASLYAYVVLSVFSEASK